MTKLVAVFVVVFIVATTARMIISVPKEGEGVVRLLAGELKQRKTGSIYLIGFPHVPWYNNRMEPLSSFYFLTISGSEVIDCGWDVSCADENPDSYGTAVIHANAFSDEESRRRLATWAASRT